MLTIKLQADDFGYVGNAPELPAEMTLELSDKTFNLIKMLQESVDFQAIRSVTIAAPYPEYEDNDEFYAYSPHIEIKGEDVYYNVSDEYVDVLYKADITSELNPPLYGLPLKNGAEQA